MLLMNIDYGIKLARTYYAVGYKLASTSLTNSAAADDEGVFKAVVGTSNLAFSAELVMKLVLYSRNCDEHKLNTHNLKQLYELLSPQDQELIEGATTEFHRDYSDQAYDHDMFLKDMDSSKDAFVETRYWHELPKPGHGRHANVLFMRCFCQALFFWLSIQPNLT